MRSSPEVAWCGAPEVTLAIDAADRAFRDWSRLPGSQRSKLIRRLYELMIRDQELLAAIMTAEQGKPLAEARGEILYAALFNGRQGALSQRGTQQAIRRPSTDGPSRRRTSWTLPSVSSSSSASSSSSIEPAMSWTVLPCAISSMNLVDDRAGGLVIRAALEPSAMSGD